MRLTIIQHTVAWADKKSNLQYVEKQIVELSGKTDLLVLPEMFTTGFVTDRLDLAEEMNDETVEILKKWAKKYRLAITGSFIAKENEQVFNRAFFVFPSTEIAWADKRHLFTLAKENEFFYAGDKRLIVNYKSFNICVLICYDLRFPVWARNVNNEYDLLIYVANFPTKRIRDWDILLKARAIENQSYVCAANRIGVDELGINYNGHSVLLDYAANEIISFDDNESGNKTAEIFLEPLKNYRNKFPVWQDADQFKLI